MTNFFGFLLLGAFTALVAGLFKPAAVVFWRKPATRVHALAYAALMLVAFIGIGVTAPPPTPAEQAATAKKLAEQTAANEAEATRKAESLAAAQRADSVVKAHELAKQEAEKRNFDARVAVLTFLKDNLNDPDVEDFDAFPVQRAGAGKEYSFYVRCRYRTRNGFGALVLQNQVFQLNDQMQVVGVAE